MMYLYGTDVEIELSEDRAMVAAIICRCVLWQRPHGAALQGSLILAGTEI